jgi:signal transduction histidine kinase
MQGLLKRQLRRCFGEESGIPAPWQTFVNGVNDAYRDFAADRALLEHSLQLSSQELFDANSELRVVFRAIPDLVFLLDQRGNDGVLVRNSVSVVREFSEVPQIMLNRQQLLQIMVNLISKARHAMEHMPGALQQITLRVALVARTSLRITVRDKGEGIPAENLARIFEHGFTSRKTGHGFGLRSCALAARQMGGTLTARSNGPGLGATFTLELPINGGRAQT